MLRILGAGSSMSTRMVDPRDAPGRRYKLFRSLVTQDKERAGVYASVSADGLHFTEAGRVLPMWPETSLIADWDPRINKYVVFMRVFVKDGENQRRVGRIEADARLIAAAPELYEALEAICSEFAQTHPLIVAGRAALSKAKA